MKKKWVKVALMATATAVVSGIAVIVASFWGKPILHGATNTVVIGWLWVTLAAISVAAAWLLVFKDRYVVAATMLVVVLIAGVSTALVWDAAKSLHQGKVFQESTEPHPEVGRRASLVQARALLKRNQGGSQGEVMSVMHLGENRWSAVVDNSISTLAVVEWDGKTEFTRCEMRDSTPAMSGKLWNSLRREIRFNLPVGTYAFDFGADAYGYCTPDGHGELVVPLTMVNFGFPPHGTYGGVVVVKSGSDIQYLPEVSPGQLPGPVYPLSLVEEVEKGNKGRNGSFGDGFHVRSLSLDVDDTGGVEVDTDGDGVPDYNPNATNAGQYVVSGGNGELWAVSPMKRSKGNAELVAVSFTRVDAGVRGEKNPTTLYLLDDVRKANVEVEKTIRSDFADLPWQSGLSVFEITPHTPEVWVGTIGVDVAPVYEFTVDPAGRVCVEKISPRQPQGCSGEQSTAVANAANTETQELEDVELDQLLELRDQVNKEIDRRLRGQ